MIYHLPQSSGKQAIRQAKGRDLSRLSNLRETNNHAGARTMDPAQHTERDKSRPSLTPFANINNMVAIVININI